MWPSPPCALRQWAHFNWELICTQAKEEPTAEVSVQLTRSCSCKSPEQELNVEYMNETWGLKWEKGLSSYNCSAGLRTTQTIQSSDRFSSPDHETASWIQARFATVCFISLQAHLNTGGKNIQPFHWSIASLIWFCTALLLEDVSTDHIPYPTAYLHSFPNFKLWTPAIPHHKGTFTTTKYYFKAILTVIGGNWVLSTNTNCGISELDFSWYFNEVCANSTKSSVTPAAEFHIQTFDRVTMC